MAKTPAWQRAAGKNPEGGLNEKGRASLRAAGHDIKRPQPEGGARKRSFCARMEGMKRKNTSAETANDPDSRINKSLRKWKCADGGPVDPYDSVQQAAKGGPIWDKPRPKNLGKSEPLSPKEKSSAKAMAKAAGRPYPNLIDNMRAARADGGATYPLADRDDWTAAKHYDEHGGRMTHMSPDAFLDRTRPLHMDDKTERSIDAYKGLIDSQHRMNPLQLLANGLEDGRHRATAAKELGVRSVPVVDFRADGGEVEGDVQFAPDDPYAKVQQAATLPIMARNDFAMRMPEPEVRYDTGPQPGEATLKAYDPTIKERIYQGIAGTEERPSPERAQFARGMSQMAEFAPVLGNVMAGQEAQRRGDTKGMLMAALPVPGMATEARMAEAAAGPAQQAISNVYESAIKRAQEQGYTGPWYHGTNRIDRLLEGKGLNPKRATSGPMPYFTDNPEIASNYAKAKADTSLVSADTGNVADYFTVHPKSLGWSGRSEIPVERTWNFLAPEVKQEILSKAKRIGYENPMEATGPLTLHPEGVEATLSPSHYDWILKNEAKGNPLAALREMWHDSGELVGRESQLEDVFRLAGYPHPISQKNAPWTEAQGVLPAMLRMERPLNTESVDEINEKVIPALEQAFKRDRTRTKTYGADQWDKNLRFTPNQWVNQLKQDMATKDNSYVWTSIPDKVTKVLKELGYDGIIDTGGKSGGGEHRVAIPFFPHQVRSKFAKFNPKHLGSPDLLKSDGGEVVNKSDPYDNIRDASKNFPRARRASN